MKSLTELGFVNRFYFGEKQLKSATSPKSFQPNELRIVEFHRFRNLSGEGSLHTVYALAPIKGKPGLFVHKYQPADPLRVVQFLDRIPIIKAEKHGAPA